MAARSKQIFQFKIGLIDIKPEIWRRILVPGDYSFWELHVAIQDAMGWADCHLHEFIILNPANGLKEGIGIPDDDFPDENPMLPGWELAMADYFSMDNNKAVYLYDFGDGWEHKILFVDPDKRWKFAFDQD